MFDTTTGNLHESLWRNQFPEFKQQGFMESCAGAHCPLLEAAGTHQLLGNATSVNKTTHLETQAANTVTLFPKRRSTYGCLP